MGIRTIEMRFCSREEKWSSIPNKDEDFPGEYSKRLVWRVSG